MSYKESNNDLPEIKERIYDEGMVEFLLEELDCQFVKQVRNDRFEAGLPARFDSDNRRSVQIYNSESLNGAIRSKGISGDIFMIVAYILYEVEDFSGLMENLYQVKAWVCNALGWDEYLSNRDDFEEVVERVDPLAFLRPLQKKRKQSGNNSKKFNKENKVINENVMSRYFDYPHYTFVKDGISPATQRFFGVMFDRESERITYPMHNKDGELIGVKGRYVGKDQRVLDEMKYLFLYRCDKSIELWNLHRAISYIKEADEVIVFESAKSCMLAWQWGYRNVISIEGSELSPVQAMLLKQLEVNIVFALDKDMDYNHLLKISKQIKSRICKAIIDKEDLIGEKDSPVDKGKDIWNLLYTKHKRSLRQTGKSK